MTRQVRITQLDGALPNLALMRLSAWHKALGDEVHYSRSATPSMFEPAYDVVYGSVLFSFTREKVERFRANFPDAILGGSGSGSDRKIESIVGFGGVGVDYSHWPDFTPSIGYSQRGCRMKCKFCIVPASEGKNRSVGTLAGIWRGDPWPKHIHLLDNDFFGQEEWAARSQEALDGGYRLCFSQGINVRLVNADVASILAQLPYYDNKFEKRRLYVAWDNLKDEKVFFRGVDMLEAAGIPSTRLMAYMLIGFDKSETWERIFHRFNKMVERGIDPYPMPYDQSRRDHKRFQRWVVTRAYRNVPWEHYDASAKGPIGADDEPDLFGRAA